MREQRRGSPPRRVRGRPRREEVRRKQPEQLTPPPPPPPPSSPTPSLPTPPSSLLQQGTSENSSILAEKRSPQPQRTVTHRDWRRLIRNVDNIRQWKDDLQEQLDYLRHEQQDEGVRETEAVAEFKHFSAAVREVAIPDHMKNLVLNPTAKRRIQRITFYISTRR
ncbi:CASP-like protein 4A1 [Lotus japonicus]|uniref:CASP-like protein 4A1 n=1 Tax=Lotus japonicus TaxID=34305 RepID=UPI00258E6D18|nr:CASP-like protein 4A1 [Lotus japonicus]